MTYKAQPITWEKINTSEFQGKIRGRIVFILNKGPLGWSINYIFFNKHGFHSKATPFKQLNAAQEKCEGILQKKIKKEVKKLKFLTIN